MNLCRLCCIGLFGIILSIIGFLIHAFHDVGQFKTVQSFGIEKCASISTPKPGYPCEDMQMLADGSMLISCGALLEILSLFSPYIPYTGYIPMKERISKLSKKSNGDVYMITSKNNYAEPVPMKLKRYVHPDFHPHGMSLIEDGNDQMVYIVNHRRDGEFLSVFKVNTDDNALEYWTSITSEAFNFINNVAVIPDTNGNFYVTNWLENEPGSYSAMFEIFAQQKSQVLYCETPDNFFKRRPSKNVHAKCSVAVDNLKDANGITLTADYKRLFVVEAKFLRGFDVDSAAYGILTDYKTIDNVHMCDNVNASPDKPNELLVGCFPKVLPLLISPKSPDIPFMIRKVDIEKGTSTPFKIDSNGSVLSGITSALQSGPFTVAVSVYDGLRYMVCSDFSTIKLMA